MSKFGVRTIKRQAGVATVESAIILVVFLMLIMGIIEFALFIFSAASLVEATREGARFLIVNNPVTVLEEPCVPGSTDETEVNCGSANCGALMGRMQRYYPQLADENVIVTYRCSSAGYSEAYEGLGVYEAEVRLDGVEHTFITPGILGLDATVEFPDFKTTRLTEDRETVPGA